MHTSMKALGLLALIAGLAWAPAQGQAGTNTITNTSTNTPTGKSTRAKARKPPADKGPAETRIERDKRLQRECRGKPNAGACEGYGG